MLSFFEKILAQLPFLIFLNLKAYVFKKSNSKLSWYLYRDILYNNTTKTVRLIKIEKMKLIIMETDKININIIKNELKNNIKITKKELIFSKWSLNLTTFLISFLNVATIGLAIWAIVILSIDIYEKNTSVSKIIMPLIVAIFTILLFVFSIILMIYNKKAKTMFYQEKANEIQYLILKLKNQKDINLDESIEKYNNMKENELNNIQNVNYKKVIKKALIKGK